MKNYKVKASQLYVGMDFYHVEGSGAYSGGEVVVKITKTPDTEAVGHQPATLKMSRLGSQKNEADGD